jgi:hypothetical protein
MLTAKSSKEKTLCALLSYSLLIHIGPKSNADRTKVQFTFRIGRCTLSQKGKRIFPYAPYTRESFSRRMIHIDADR